MKTLRLFLLPILCLSLMVTLSHCTSDDSGDIIGDEVGDEIDLTDGNALVEAITIAGATVVTGDLPAPTGGDAPILDDPDDIVTSQGGSPQFPVNTSGDVAGVYLQFPGADSYYDIPASAFTGGRLENHGDASFSFDLPDNIQPGIFCVEYCVYDSDLLVSNIVEVCIEITEFGGENSDFLIGIWQVISFTETDDNGDPEIIVIGTDTLKNTYIFNCDATSMVEVTETEFYDFIKFTFSENGALRFEASFADRYFDFDNSTCDNILYIEESGTDDIIAAWSYEDATKRLILVIEFDDEEGEEVLDLTISVVGNTMTATESIDINNIETIILEKQ